MIVLTGATGFLGQELLRKFGTDVDLLVVSRNPAKAEQQNPRIRACHYDDLSEFDLSEAVFIHLAARNNDTPGTLEDFRTVNVDFLLHVAAIARTGGARQFVNLSSSHALTPDINDYYGRSKQEGAEKLREYWPEAVINLYLPAVYGDTFRGRLSILNSAPQFTRGPALAILGQAKPKLSIENLHFRLQDLINAEHIPGEALRSEQYVADPIPDTGMYSVLKRLMDLVAGIAILVLGWPILALVALYVRMDSAGPAIFAQSRVGQHGRVFSCYKFRTMSVGTEDAATHDVAASAVTQAGHFLRRTKLDELPQAINLLLNDMSLVGPRPCLPSQTELVAVRRDRGVLQMKAGITGLAQINDIDMSDPERLAAWDSRYGAFRTTLSDLVIVISTVLGRGSGDRVKTSLEPLAGQ